MGSFGMAVKMSSLQHNLSFNVLFVQHSHVIGRFFFKVLQSIPLVHHSWVVVLPSAPLKVLQEKPCQMPMRWSMLSRCSWSLSKQTHKVGMIICGIDSLNLLTGPISEYPLFTSYSIFTFYFDNKVFILCIFQLADRCFHNKISLEAKYF